MDAVSESKEARDILDALRALGDSIEWLEAELYRQRAERDRLRRIEIEKLRATLTLQPDRHRATATHTRHLRFGDSNLECGRNGRVDRVTSLPQHRRTRVRGQPMRP